MVAFYRRHNCEFCRAIKHFAFFALWSRSDNYSLRVAGKLFVVADFFISSPLGGLVWFPLLSNYIFALLYFVFS